MLQGASHYAVNIIEKMAGTTSSGQEWHVPAYYNGQVPDNCLVLVYGEKIREDT
jgi:hypothetical protein